MKPGKITVKQWNVVYVDMFPRAYFHERKKAETLAKELRVAFKKARPFVTVIPDTLQNAMKPMWFPKIGKEP